MVIIDGKPATDREMKNLSAYDIDHITVKADAEIKALYGDKPKTAWCLSLPKRRIETII